MGSTDFIFRTSRDCGNNETDNLLKSSLVKTDSVITLHERLTLLVLIMSDMQGCTNRVECRAELSKAFYGMEGQNEVILPVCQNCETQDGLLKENKSIAVILLNIQTACNVATFIIVGETK